MSLCIPLQVQGSDLEKGALQVDAQKEWPGLTADEEDMRKEMLQAAAEKMLEEKNETWERGEAVGDLTNSRC